MPRRRDGALPDSAVWEILLRHKMFASERDELACHEVAEILAEQVRYRLEDRETFCDELGWALQAPDAAILRLFAEHSFALALIGEELGLFDYVVALRLSQSCSYPAILCTPDGLRMIGDAPWPHDDTLTMHQSMFTGILPKGILAVDLLDLAGSKVLFALDT